MEERYEAKLDAMNDVIAEKVGEYVGEHLEEIVSDHEDEIIEILKKRGRGWRKRGVPAGGQQKEELILKTAEQDKDVVQFENLSKCEFEKGERFPSGRRLCIISTIPCGFEDSAKCPQLVMQKKAREERAAYMKAKADGAVRVGKRKNRRKADADS